MAPPLGESFATLFFMPLQSATPAPAIVDEVLLELGLPNDGRPIYLNFFRSDCPWCATEMPRLSDIYARHQKLNYHAIAIACGQDSLDSATQFAQSRQISLPLYADANGALKSVFGIDRVPAIVMIGGQGLVERTFIGVTEQLPGIVEQTLYAGADGSQPPAYDMVGNGCAA